jgi:hypothetical protein
MRFAERVKELESRFIARLAGWKELAKTNLPSLSGPIFGGGSTSIKCRSEEDAKLPNQLRAIAVILFRISVLPDLSGEGEAKVDHCIASTQSFSSKLHGLREENVAEQAS